MKSRSVKQKLPFSEIAKRYRGGRISLWSIPFVVQRRLHFKIRPYIYSLKRCFPAVVTLSTSQTDRFDYKYVCERAATNDRAFRTFKRHCSYRPVIEHVSKKQGQAYLDIIKKEGKELLGLMEKFRQNDSLGSPITHEYEIGRISPTTLRYIKVLSDIKRTFGNLDGASIVEIGSGYGGQCKIVSDAIMFSSYTAIDLKPSLMLMEKCMLLLNVHNVSYVRPSEAHSDKIYDLVISNYSFSECTKKMQDWYIDQIFRTAPRGYITYNADSKKPQSDLPWVPYNKEQITRILSRYHHLQIIPEVPQTGRKTRNFIIIWDETKYTTKN